ncbi:MAG TPA: hypothetical protein VG797_02760 [Phycisphaerales bacterium]|nr:hypothetical protein [Phycisphaerales bacterium]
MNRPSTGHQKPNAFTQPAKRGAPTDFKQDGKVGQHASDETKKDGAARGHFKKRPK